MGKRGPQPGTTYKKRRILVPRELKVRNDRELNEAQKFNEALENFLVMFLDEGAYPLNGIQAALVEQVVESVEVLQSAVIEGVQAYYGRLSSPPSSASSTPTNESENFLPGSYGMGAQRGRKPTAGGGI